MPSIAERIRALRGDMSLAAFAEATGIARSTLGRYEQGVGSPDAEAIMALCRVGKVTTDWLIFGTDDPVSIDPQATLAVSSGAAPSTVACADCDVVMIPKVQARLSAGGGSLEANGDPVGSYAFRSDWLVRKGQVASMVLMDVVGDSMAPAIEDGDMVLIDQSQTGVVPGAIYAVGVEDGVYVKRLDFLPGTLVLNSVNPTYSPIEVPLRGDLADTVRVIGRIIWWCREAK
nr:S24 family peptidase [Nitratidesulfovibrio liaohensis]